MRVVGAVVVLLACASAAAAQGLQLRVMSNPRAEFVSGGDVLVSVSLPPGTSMSSARLMLNGSDVTSALRADAGGRSAQAFLKNLNDGNNTLMATAGKATAKLTVVNHPNAGPVISGPHEQPFICETETFKLMVGGVAGKALDTNCSIATRIDYVYKSTAGGDLKPLPVKTVGADLKVGPYEVSKVGPSAGGPSEGGPYPPDVAMTTTSLGVQVPFIVRVETGTINRGVYEIAMLFDPAKDVQPDFMTRPAGWNGRLIYTFGGSAGQLDSVGDGCWRSIRM